MAQQSGTLGWRNEKAVDESAGAQISVRDGNTQGGPEVESGSGLSGRRCCEQECGRGCDKDAHDSGWVCSSTSVRSS
jgi:hypothetical protein